MHVHLVGVAGTGMGAFAGLLKAQGHRVTGSDTAFYPPMGDALRAWGIETYTGFDPAHLDPVPDLVVIGNVCRRDNPEARAAIDRGLSYQSFPKALAGLFLAGRRSLVIAGTHGKTTSTALVAYLLHALGMDPSFLVGGVALDFDASFRLGRGGAFVLEGDEYDSAFFEKTPKFWSYRPWGALLTSIEHDHVDIYPTLEAYRSAFRGFVSRLSPEGVLVAHARDTEVVSVARESPGRVVYYGLTTDDDPAGVTPTWQAAPIAPTGSMQPFELFIGGTSAGRFFSPLMGEHNLRNTVGSLALLSEGLELPVASLARSLQGFHSVRRRQELVADVHGVRIYDDFAHHPTAVFETLRAMRGHVGKGRLIAVFEPRSATACRRTHQSDYARAFEAADLTVIAPVGRTEIPDGERLDVPAIVQDLRAHDRDADTVAPGPGSVDAIVQRVVAYARAGDFIAVLSNGAFGGIHATLRMALERAHGAGGA